MNKKPYIHKRIIAYVIDIFIIAMISSILVVPFNKNEEYEKKYNELLQITESIKDEKLTDGEYNQKFNDINYDLSKINVSQTIVISIVSLLYFVGYNYYNKGQSIGKKVMKLRIVSSDESNVSVNRYLIRTLVGSTTLSNIVTAILILTLSKESYLIYESKFSTVFAVIYLACFCFAMYRNDGKGLHDLLAQTLVVNDKNESNEIKEAIVIKEKNNDNKEVK